MQYVAAHPGTVGLPLRLSPPPPAEQCVAPVNNDTVEQRPAIAPRNVIDVDDDEQEEEEDERDEGGEGQKEEEVEGEGRFCLGQEHDSRADGERELSEWPPDY